MRPFCQITLTTCVTIFPLVVSVLVVSLWCVGAYRTALRQLRQSVSALESFVHNHLQYDQADDVRIINSVTVRFDSLVSRLIHLTAAIMDRYHVTSHGRLATHEPRATTVDTCETVDVEMLLAVDMSRLLSDIRTASQLISLTT